MLHKPRCLPTGEPQMYGVAEGKKMCDSTSGWELIFEIYFLGNG